MTLRLHRTTSFSKTAGLWLRCFLGGALVGGTLMGSVCPTTLQAMTCVSQPRIHIKQVRGIVYDPSGVVMPDAVVQVLEHGQVLKETRSDTNGNFEVDIAPGEYDIRVQASGFWNTNQPIKVENTFGTRFRSRQLSWVLGMGGTTCSLCTTNERLFKHEIAVFSERLNRVH